MPEVSTDTGARTRRRKYAIAAAALALIHVAGAESPPSPDDAGRKVYEFYCYQCHGYSGDAKTLASTFVDPPPRNFVAPGSRSLDRAAMIDAVTAGRPGTAMTSFRDVLAPADIAAVVDYIRRAFMRADPPELNYHTDANGWSGHERYGAAFPFATGEIPLDTPWEALSPDQTRGKRLYMSACISCHDRGSVTHEGVPWEARSVSYPRRHYSHRKALNIDGISGATPFYRHDAQPAPAGLGPEARRGEALFRINCAFCHGGDGSGRNWIGSFLEPHPRDLGGAQVARMSDAELRTAIRDGLTGTSMPAWRDVLDAAAIDSIIVYIREAFGHVRSDSEAGTAAADPGVAFGWERRSKVETPAPSTPGSGTSLQ